MRGIERHRLNQLDGVGGLAVREQRERLYHSLAFRSSRRSGAGPLSLLRQRRRQQLARGVGIFQDRRHNQPLAERAFGQDAVVFSLGEAGLRPIRKSDQGFADRELRQAAAGAGAAAERERTDLEIGRELAGLFHAPAIGCAEHADRDHVDFVAAPAHRCDLLLGECLITRQHGDLVKADPRAGRVLELDRVLHDPPGVRVLAALEIGLAEIGPPKRLVGRDLGRELKLANRFRAIALLLVQQRRVGERCVVVGIGGEPDLIGIERLLHIRLRGRVIAGINVMPLNLADLAAQLVGTRGHLA